MVMLASESCAEAKFVTERVGMPIVLNTDRINENKKHQSFIGISLDQFLLFYYWFGGEGRQGGSELPAYRTLYCPYRPSLGAPASRKILRYVAKKKIKFLPFPSTL